ncbi:hypothetical protein SeMB42_g04058 [Synchytrium endobioticum]|uniref:Uncharacterized protein n=1 Tax=Synchytrium endobioticum TaxID=286115 RepID=A0A507D1H4_9FUNG|nr:hypothetical protein SeMB42_g04058 [Synchytrium endobioticum]
MSANQLLVDSVSHRGAGFILQGDRFNPFGEKVCHTTDITIAIRCNREWANKVDGDFRKGAIRLCWLQWSVVEIDSVLAKFARF